MTCLNPYTSRTAGETAIVESAHEATEQAQLVWLRSLDLMMQTQTVIVDIERMCERTQVSIATSRMILGEEVTHIGQEKPANLGKDPAKTGKH